MTVGKREEERRAIEDRNWWRSVVDIMGWASVYGWNHRYGAALVDQHQRHHEVDGEVALKLVAQRDDLAAAREAQQAVERERDALLEALQWSSGAPSFLPGGEAREGWLKLCAPLLGLTAKEPAP